MNQIRPWLFIGKYRDTTNLSLLESHHIGAMLQFAELVEHPGIVSLYIGQEDGQPIPYKHFHKGLNFILSNKSAGRKVLVSCGAGMSRSAVFTMAALMKTEQMDITGAFREVRRLHPDTMPHPVLWKSLCKYFGVDVPFTIYPVNG